MITFESVMYKIKQLFNSRLDDNDNFKSDKYSIVIETDFEHDKHKDKVESHVPGLNSYGMFEDTAEYIQCQELKSEIEYALRIAKEKQLNCEILFPCGLISKISQDVLRMSQDEPYGLRGCVLYINLDEKNACRRIAKIVCDPMKVATFELYLTLREDNRGWCMLHKLFVTVKSCLKNSKWRTFAKILCSGFILEKNKLYRSNSQ